MFGLGKSKPVKVNLTQQAFIHGRHIGIHVWELCSATGVTAMQSDVEAMLDRVEDEVLKRWEDDETKNVTEEDLATRYADFFNVSKDIVQAAWREHMRHESREMATFKKEEAKAERKRRKLMNYN